MNNISNYSPHVNTSALAKLRRLKIQESVLYSSLNKSLSISYSENEDNTKPPAFSDIKRLESSLNILFIEIRNLFEDIRISVNSFKNSEKLDIDEIKRDIFHLEAKLRTFKKYLRTELSTLILTAKEIEYKLSISSTDQIVRKNEPIKSRVKSFTKIVPSPVRIHINCPFKCPEVQNLQEFLKNTRKHYKGWNEYNHKVFIQIWNKYFQCDNTFKRDDSLENDDRFRRFHEEVLEKITGLTIEDVTVHYKWYSEYIYLKNCQQKALEKWKENKSKLKKASSKTEKITHGKQANSNDSTAKPTKCHYGLLKNQTANTVKWQFSNNPSRSLYSRTIKPLENNEKSCNFGQIMDNMLKTEQRKPELLNFKHPFQLYGITTDKRQLRVPTWRLGLYEN